MAVVSQFTRDKNKNRLNFCGFNFCGFDILGKSAEINTPQKIVSLQYISKLTSKVGHLTCNISNRRGP